jgi:hypothetical protein
MVIVDFEALQEYVPPAGLPVAVHEPKVSSGGAAERGLPRARLGLSHVNVTFTTVTGPVGFGEAYWHAGSDPSVQICPWLTGTDGI